MCEVREEYNRRMGSIEGKFRAICQRYHELTLELAGKNEAIERMAQQIAHLQAQLEEANHTIKGFEQRAASAEQSSKAISSNLRPSNGESSQPIEADPLPSPQLI